MLLLVVVILLALGRREARAESPAIVRLRSSNPAFDERLDAELAALGFAVKGVDVGDAATDLAAIARANGAVASIRVSPGNLLELWVEPSQPGDPSTRETVRIDTRQGWDVAAIVALEGLRARLLEVRSGGRSAAVAASPSPPVSEPTPVSPSLATARRPWLWLHLAAAVDASPGGMSPAFDGFLEVRLEPRAWFSVGIFGAGTPLASSVEAPEGEALVRHAIVGFALDLQKQLSRVTVSLGAGGAFIPFFVEGRSPAAGYGAHDASADSLALLLRAAASVEVAPALRLRIAIAAGVTFPLVTISFADREEATWGRPFGLSTLGLEWGAIR
jgi:hypothetical protein